MSDCVCGARGIDLDGHKCVPSLESALAAARATIDAQAVELGRQRESLKVAGDAIVVAVKQSVAAEAELARYRQLDAQLGERKFREEVRVHHPECAAHATHHGECWKTEMKRWPYVEQSGVVQVTLPALPLDGEGKEG